MITTIQDSNNSILEMIDSIELAATIVIVLSGLIGLVFALIQRKLVANVVYYFELRDDGLG